MAETTCPVFRPTEQEFKSFRRYIEDVVDPIAGKAGLCKVIPPPGWAARRRDAAEEMCKSVCIPAPIKQCVSSTRSNGVYSVDVVENPPMTLAEFKEYADKRAPFPSSTATAGFAGAAAVGVRRGRSGGGAEGIGGGKSGGVDGDKSKGGRGNGGRGYGGGCGFGSGGGGARRSGSGGPTGRAGGGESEVARRVRMFWRSLGPNSEAPVYGADTLGTLFAADDNDAWNVGKLDTILQLLKANLPGITTAMLYAGMWRSMFAFHVEDVNLYSINYLHRGDPKSWYGIPPDSRQRFESLAQAFFTEEFRACKDHMRHKTTMISPLQIQKAGIANCTAVQEAGEFMITFPGSYHGGFNHGFNLAESTNFALDRWIRQGRGAGYCRCSPHSVRIDVDRFETLVRQHRRIAGKEATCLNGLAEGPPGSLLPDGRASDDVAQKRDAGQAAVTAAAAEEAAATSSPGSGGNDARGEESDAESSCSDDDDEEEERKRREEVEEDIQVFHCVCSNARSVRRVQRADDGAGFVPLPAPAAPVGKAPATPWPEESQCSECPRCGVWGHKACLEYVVPPQFAIPERRIGAVVSAPVWGSGSGSGTNDPAAGALGEGADAAGQRGGSEAPGASAEGATGTENGSGAAAAAASAAVAAAPFVPPPPRPVCWMCMQEQEEAAAFDASRGGAGGMAAAAPRRPGKSSGGSTSGANGGGGGGSTSGSTSGGVSSARCPPGRKDAENGGSRSGGNKKGAKKRIGGGKTEERKGGKKARAGEGVSIGGGGSGGAAAGRKMSSDGSVVSSAPAGTAAPSALKRARVGPKLIGKEVLVSDGVAAVLTGVVTEIEAGQARVHYRGRNAKLDEWIDVRSERFLSTSEAKKQMALTQLAMNPSAPAVPASPTAAAGKKRKAASGGGGGGDSAGAEGKRAKRSGGKGDGGGGNVKVKTAKKRIGKAGKASGDGGKSSPPVKPKRKKTKEEIEGGGGRKAAGSQKVAKTTSDGEHGKDGGGDGQNVAGGKTEGAGGDKGSSPKLKGKSKAGKLVKVGKTVKVGKGLASEMVGGSKVGPKSGRADVKVRKIDGASGGPGQAKGGGGSPKKRESGCNGTSAATSNANGSSGSVKVKDTQKKKKKKKDKPEKQEKLKTKKPPAFKPVVIAPPVVVQRAVPEHHVISNRRAAVLARSFAKETEEAERDFREAVAAAERSRLARKQRAKSSSSPRGLSKKGNAAAAAAGRGPRGGVGAGGGSSSGGSGVSAAGTDPAKRAAARGAGCPPPGSALADPTALANTGERWPDLGFVGQPWGRGPFHREMDSGGEEQDDDLDDDDVVPSSFARFGGATASGKRPVLGARWLGDSAGGATGSGATTLGVRGEFQGGGQSGARLPEEVASATTAAAVVGGLSAPSRPRRTPKEMRRARVEAGERVDLGEEGAYRAWLTRLRAVQDIPVGHVEACSRSLAVLLGTAPPDGSIRASVRALLVAETLRGGASHEVATFVRSLAGLLADAASKARPLPAARRGGPEECTPPDRKGGYHAGVQQSAGGQNAAAAASVGGAGCRPAENSWVGGGGGGCGGNDSGGGDGGGGDAQPPAASIRDTEGAAAYAHALSHLARSRTKQKWATAVAAREKAEAEAAVAAAAQVLAEAQGNKRGKKTKKEAWAVRQHSDAVEAAQAAVLPPSRVPAPAVAGSIPGGHPFSRSGGELLMYAKAMVGLKRSQRWVTGWLEAPPPPPPPAGPVAGSKGFVDARSNDTSGSSGIGASNSGSGSNSGSNSGNGIKGGSGSNSDGGGNGGGNSGSNSNGGSGGSGNSSALNLGSDGSRSKKQKKVAAVVKAVNAPIAPLRSAPSSGGIEPSQAATAAHTSPLVAAAAAAACASASASASPCAAVSAHQSLSPTVGAAAPVLGWQNSFSRSLPPHASLRAAVMSSTPAMAMGAYHYPTGAATTANTATGGVVPSAALPILHPRPYIHEPYGALNAAVGSAAAYRSGLLALWPPQQAAVATAAAVGAAGAGTAGLPSPPNPSSAVPAHAAAVGAQGPSPAKSGPVDLLERWARVGAVSVVPPTGQGAALWGREDEEVVVADE